MPLDKPLREPETRRQKNRKHSGGQCSVPYWNVHFHRCGCALRLKAIRSYVALRNAYSYRTTVAMPPCICCSLWQCNRKCPR